jgi:hypothetical protein
MSRAAGLLALVSACAYINRGPPYDAFLPVHFESLPNDPYDAGYLCRVVSTWQWPEMTCSVSNDGGQT